jgi:hypothetical protein
MMNHLLLDTKEAASSLVQKVKTFKIRKVVGEDIYKVVSLLCSTINCLTYIHKLPEDIVKITAGVFQMTSVDNFDATFHLNEKQCRIQYYVRQA